MGVRSLMPSEPVVAPMIPRREGHLARAPLGEQSRAEQHAIGSADAGRQDFTGGSGRGVTVFQRPATGARLPHRAARAPGRRAVHARVTAARDPLDVVRLPRAVS